MLAGEQWQPAGHARVNAVLLVIQQGAAEGEPVEASANHLEDVLSMDSDWDSIVEDVDQAMQDVDGRDALFAGLAD